MSSMRAHGVEDGRMGPIGSISATVDQLEFMGHFFLFYLFIQWLGLDWIGLDWNGLDYIWPVWLNWIGSVGSLGFESFGWDWIELDWISLVGSLGFEWFGWGWIGLRRLVVFRLNWIDWFRLDSTESVRLGSMDLGSLNQIIWIGLSLLDWLGSASMKSLDWIH